MESRTPRYMLCWGLTFISEMVMIALLMCIDQDEEGSNLWNMATLSMVAIILSTLVSFPTCWVAHDIMRFWTVTLPYTLLFLLSQIFWGVTMMYHRDAFYALVASAGILLFRLPGYINEWVLGFQILQRTYRR